MSFENYEFFLIILSAVICVLLYIKYPIKPEIIVERKKQFKKSYLHETESMIRLQLIHGDVKQDRKILMESLKNIQTVIINDEL